MHVNSCRSFPIRLKRAMARASVNKNKPIQLNMKSTAMLAGLRMEYSKYKNRAGSSLAMEAPKAPKTSMRVEMGKNLWGLAVKANMGERKSHLAVRWLRVSPKARFAGTLPSFKTR